MQSDKLALIVFPLRITHIAGFEELLVHSQSAAQYMRCVRRLRHLKVLVQHRTIRRIYAVIDDLMRTLDRTLATQVSNTVLGDDNLHRVLRVIHMAYHGHKR